MLGAEVLCWRADSRNECSDSMYMFDLFGAPNRRRNQWNAPINRKISFRLQSKSIIGLHTRDKFRLKLFIHNNLDSLTSTIRHNNFNTCKWNWRFPVNSRALLVPRNELIVCIAFDVYSSKSQMEIGCSPYWCSVINSRERAQRIIHRALNPASVERNLWMRCIWVEQWWW